MWEWSLRIRWANTWSVHFPIVIIQPLSAIFKHYFRPPTPPRVNYSDSIKVISGRSTFVPVLYLASFKTHYNSVIVSNPLGVTICLHHEAHAYRNTLTQKKSIEYKEGRTWMRSRLRRGDRNISPPWKHAESRMGGCYLFTPFEQHWSCLRIKMSGPVVIDCRLLGEQSVNPQEGPQWELSRVIKVWNALFCLFASLLSVRLFLHI